MCFQTNVEKNYAEQEVNRQICARGWQDYMMETQFFLGDERVNDCLKRLDVPQLVKLGLSNADMLNLHKPVLADEAELVKLAA
ncbi:MAG: hypothetical protein L3J67_07785 [Hyphomicrobiaceae bacterium]|nr:hypothetical protein [Hyphomicrobiaceae bacterium]